MSFFNNYFRSVVWIALVVSPLKSVQAASLQTNSITASMPVKTNSLAAQSALLGTNKNSVVKASALKKSMGSIKREIVSISRARELADQGKDEEAIRVCDILIRKGSFDARDALRQKGVCLHRLGRYADACVCWEYMLNGRMVQSRDDDIVLKLASTYAFSLRDAAKAEKYYQRLLKQPPRSEFLAEAQYQYAGIRYVANDYTNAAALFQAHLRAFPGSAYAEKTKEYLGLCEKAIEAREMAVMKAKVMAAEVVPPPPVAQKSRIQRTFEEAESLFARKLYKEAIKSYQSVANDSFCRERTAAVYRMGQCNSELGKDLEALRHWEESAKRVQRDTNTCYAVQSLKAMGDTYFDKLAEEEPAIKYYRKLVATYPDDALVPEVMEKIGIIYLYQGKVEEAKPIFESLRPVTPPDPNEPPTGLDRLIALCDGRAAAQLPDLKMTARSNRAAVAMRKGDVFFTAKRYEEALKAYKAAESLDKGSEDSARALMQAGRCYRQLGDMDAAIRCYQPFFKEYARSQWADDALLRLAVIYMGQPGGRKDGVATLEKVVARYPNGDQADRSVVYLATIAGWDRDWKTAKGFYVTLLQQYPDSDYRAYVKVVALPQLDQGMAADAKAARVRKVKGQG